jgi:glycyl-tRNA synthetase
VLTMQDALARLSAYWAEQGCLTVQPMNTEVGAGTLNPATALRVLGPEPWKVAYVEPSVRPDDARYGEDPNRIQCHTQFQVILKPEPGDAQERYLGSLQALGVDVTAHDVRFVEDNWASPALGAWGLGWEVWLDGLEITQFTYFQQAGGINLDPPSVEITYGVERILMALQGVRHFKDITYAPGVTYGELFLQAEYEMSRYYLDDADVAANRALLDIYAAEAHRMVEAGLPVPAHTYVLKMSHAFNVLDARGVVSTAERATEFARMRHLSNAVAKLWVATREKAGFPLGVVTPSAPAQVTAGGAAPGRPSTVVFEIGVEEMPPAEARAARDHVETELVERLRASRLTHGAVTVHATPRRIVATVHSVAPAETDQTRTVRGPKVSAAYTADGSPTPAAAGFARSNHVTVGELQRTAVGGVEYVVVDRFEAGRPAAEALAPVLSGIVGGLRSAKNMRWRDPGLSFTRPIRWLLALLGDQVVPVTASGLAGGRATRVHRSAPAPVVDVPDADAYAALMAAAGIVTDPHVRRQNIAAAATDLAGGVGGHVDLEGESALLDQITFLVEQPAPILGAFDPGYLDLPEAVLTTVMRKHQRYLPVRDAAGRLLPHFIAIGNGTIDTDVVRAGNEAVLRARFEDAGFFYRADLATPLPDMRQRLAHLTFTDQLGSMGDRADRIAGLAFDLAGMVRLSRADEATLRRAAELVKFDLGSQMVVELTSLAGTMAQQYALAAGETDVVAQALFDAELPRTAGGATPATVPGALLSLADRLDALVGLAATVGLPTGSSDPFAVRRAGLGVLAVSRAHHILGLVGTDQMIRLAAARQPVAVDRSTIEAIEQFVSRRFEQQLADEGHPIDRIRAVLVHANRPGLVDQLLRQLDELGNRQDFTALAGALQRARRIVPAETTPQYDSTALVDEAERHLHDTLDAVRNDLDGRVDLRHFTATAGRLTEPINAFFDQVLVMSDEPWLRAARLGLLAAIRDLGGQQLDWAALRL